MVRWVLILGGFFAPVVGFNFLAMVTDHGSGSSDLHRRLSNIDPKRLISVGELFCPTEKLVGAHGDRPCATALFDADTLAPAAETCGPFSTSPHKYKYVNAIETQLAKRNNVNRRTIERTRDKLIRLAAEPIASPSSFLRRVRSAACDAAIGSGKPCLFAFKVFPVYFDNDLSKIGRLLNATNVAVLQLERRDEVARCYSNFRRFELPGCLKRKEKKIERGAAAADALLASPPRTFPAFRDSAWAGNATAAIRDACPCNSCARAARLGVRNTYHAYLETEVMPRIPHRPWLRVVFEDLYSEDSAVKAKTEAAVAAFTASLLGLPPRARGATKSR